MQIFKGANCNFIQKRSIFTHRNLYILNICCTFAAILRYIQIMRHTTFLLSLAALLFAGNVRVQAETYTNLTHDIDTDWKEGKLVLSGSDKVGTYASIPMSYNCAESAVFGNVSTQKHIKLYNKWDYITTSTALKNLKEITIIHEPSKVCGNIQVYISTDGSTWGSALSGDMIAYHSGSITATVPEGTYYVKIRNCSADDVSIAIIRYQMTNCNCFTFTP